MVSVELYQTPVIQITVIKIMYKREQVQVKRAKNTS